MPSLKAHPLLTEVVHAEDEVGTVSDPLQENSVRQTSTIWVKYWLLCMHHNIGNIFQLKTPMKS